MVQRLTHTVLAFYLQCSAAFSESCVVSDTLLYSGCCAKWFVSIITTDSAKPGRWVGWMYVICFLSEQCYPHAWIQQDVTQSVLAPNPHIYDWDMAEFGLQGLHNLSVPCFPRSVVWWSRPPHKWSQGWSEMMQVTCWSSACLVHGKYSLNNSPGNCFHWGRLMWKWCFIFWLMEWH